MYKRQAQRLFGLTQQTLERQLTLNQTRVEVIPLLQADIRQKLQILTNLVQVIIQQPQILQTHILAIVEL